MTKRRTFDRKYVFTELDKLSASIVVPTQFFIIGGLALISYGLKEATKDIDVVVRSARYRVERQNNQRLINKLLLRYENAHLTHELSRGNWSIA